MKFIQITDVHFVPGDNLLYETSPKERLLGGVELINREHKDCDFVLVTGDLAHKGEVEAYRTLKGVLDQVELPVYLMMGNHDSRAPFREIFPNQPEIDGGFVQFRIEAEGVHILCLDSLNDVYGDHVGRLCQARLDWLDQELSATPSDVQLIVACHHPPFDLGMPNMDEIKLADGDALYEVLSKRLPDQMIFGHVHRPICGNWRGIPFHIQRGFNHQVALTFERNPVLQFCEEHPDLAIVQTSKDGVQIFTRSVGGEVRHYPANGELT